MPDILHDFPIRAPIDRVFDAVATPGGLDAWWTLRAAGEARVGAVWELHFGEGYDWRAVVSGTEFGRRIEWTIGASDRDWRGTRVGLELTPIDGGTQVRFWHCGWPEANAHFRTSSYCWAMYLRVLARWLELGVRVPYEQRLDA